MAIISGGVGVEWLGAAFAALQQFSIVEVVVRFASTFWCDATI